MSIGSLMSARRRERQSPQPPSTPGTMRGAFRPATSGTTMTRATFAAVSGTNVMAIDLKLSSSASGPTL